MKRSAEQKTQEPTKQQHEEDKEERKLRVRRLSGEDRFDEDDPDLAPAGTSDTEPENKWDDEGGEYGMDSIPVPSLEVKDFAGRYEIEYLEAGHWHEVNKVQKDRAYVIISATGEGRYYVDRSISGYFSLEKLASDTAKVHWRKTRASCDYRKAKEAAKEKDDDYDEEQSEYENDHTIVRTGSIFFWDDGREANPQSKGQLRVMLVLTEDDGGYMFVLKRIADGDGNVILRVAKRMRQEKSLNDDDAEQEEDEEDDDSDEDEEESRRKKRKSDEQEKKEEARPTTKAFHDDEDEDEYLPEPRPVRRSNPSVDDLVLEGESDGEPNWDGEHGPDDFGCDSAYDPNLKIADFAGRYDVETVFAGADWDAKNVNKKRAYVDITPTGEGKVYVDRSVNAYFSLEKVEQNAKKKASSVEVHWIKGERMRAYQRKRGWIQPRDEKRQDLGHEGAIYFTDKEKRHAVMMLREEEGGDDGMMVVLTKRA